MLESFSCKLPELIQIFVKIVQIKSDTGDNSGSLLGKLVEVSKNNPKFTLDDVLGETITILVGVCLSIKHFQFPFVQFKH